MQSYENVDIAYTTSSSLSSWTGPSAVSEPNPIHAVRQAGDTVPSDSFEWTTREISLVQLDGGEYVSMGPGFPSYAHFSPISLLRSWRPFSSVYHNFYSFSFESIEVRISATNPKSIVGGVVVGWFPFRDFYDENVIGTVDVWMSNDLHSSALMNSTDSQLMLLGAAQDATFTIPWPFKYTSYLMHWLLDLDDGSQDKRPPSGSPIIYLKLLSSNYVSSISNPAQFRVFAKLNGLKFYGPGISDFEMQSGAEVFAGVAAAAALDKAAEFAVDSIAAFSEETAGPAPSYTSTPGNYDNPSAVQMSYFGDTTSSDFPLTRPPFVSGLPPPDESETTLIATYLNQPQFVVAAQSGSTYTRLRMDPMNFFESPEAHPEANYFSYFGGINQFWRGGLNFIIVVAGHPMVECRLVGSISYNNQVSPTVPLSGFNNYSTLDKTFMGCSTITFPMPFLSPLDYLPINDQLVTPVKVAPAYLDVKLEVVSTMLDILPVIPFYVFVVAGKDFSFYQPYPPGLYYTPETLPPGAQRLESESSEEPKMTDLEKQLEYYTERLKALETGDEPRFQGELKVVRYAIKNLESQFLTFQIGLPILEVNEIAPTRAAITKDPGTLCAFTDMLDYMKIWSRCVPFDDYDNDGDEEPIPDATWGIISPCWFPPVDRARDMNAQNSWYFTLDYVHYLSILFMYYRGSIAGKAIYNPTSRTEATDALYVTQLAPCVTCRKPSHCPFPWDQNTLPALSNFGAGTFCTSAKLQPVLEFTIPYRGSTIWADTIPQMVRRGIARNEDPIQASVTTNIQLQNTETDVLADALYRKVDKDFVLGMRSTFPPPDRKSVV